MNARDFLNIRLAVVFLMAAAVVAGGVGVYQHPDFGSISRVCGCLAGLLQLLGKPGYRKGE